MQKHVTRKGGARVSSKALINCKGKGRQLAEGEQFNQSIRRYGRTNQPPELSSPTTQHKPSKKGAGVILAAGTGRHMLGRSTRGGVGNVVGQVKGRVRVCHSKVTQG